MKTGILRVLILPGFLVHSSPAQDVSEILVRLQERYESINDAYVSFAQIVKFGVTQSKQSFSGKLWMKKGSKYRIETEQQTIVTDGKTVWTYSDLNKQVFVDAFRDDPKTLTPDKVLIAAPRSYSAAIISREKVGDRETIVLKLIPKDKKSTIKTLKAWVDPAEWLIRKAEILDVGDNVTTYVVDDVRINGGIKDEVFQFDVPPDAEVIDLRTSP